MDLPERVYSWWDHQPLALPSNGGLRLNLILANGALARRCVETGIGR